MPETLDCVVIGAGVIGLAIARALALAGREVVVLEAEPAFGTHTSSRNSEVIHAGIYYPTGSLKARLCVQGRKALYRYCAERHVEHGRIGKLLVATAENEMPGLARYRELAQANGVDDLAVLSAAQVRELEPEVECAGALLSPSTGIVDSHGLMLAYLADAQAHGATLVTRSPVTGGTISGNGILLDVGDAEPMQVLCKTVVNSAGHGAPALARKLRGFAHEAIPRQLHAVGHYYALSGANPFKHLVYPVSRPDWPGIHVTLDLAGNCRFGPDISLRTGIDYAFDDSRAPAFYQAIRRYYPGLQDGALRPGYTGIRPRMSRGDALVGDFMIEGPATHGVDGLVNLFGIESPGLTASLAIAEHVSGLLGHGGNQAAGNPERLG